MTNDKRYVIIVEGQFPSIHSKTANALLRFAPTSAVALIDSTHAGKSAQDVIGYGGDVPVCGSFLMTSSDIILSPNLTG